MSPEEVCEDWNPVISFVSRTDRASLVFKRTLFNKLVHSEIQKRKAYVIAYNDSVDPF